MLKYEWLTGPAQDPDDLTVNWRQQDGNTGKEQNTEGLTLQQFAEKTETYFRGIGGTLSVRICDIDNRKVTLWGGDTVGGFRFFPSPLTARPGSGRRFRRA